MASLVWLGLLRLEESIEFPKPIATAVDVDDVHVMEQAIENRGGEDLIVVAIVRRRLEIDRELYTLLQILSVHLLEKTPLSQVLSAPGYTLKDADIRNQLSLFNF